MNERRHLPAQADGLAPAGPARKRRIVVATLVLLLVTPAVAVMADLHARTGWDAWKAVHLGLFAVLFSLAAFGCVQAIIGLAVRARGGDHRQLRVAPSDEAGVTPLAPTAIVMPVYNEDPVRTSAGLRALWDSLERLGELDHFEFFILSDTTDPNRWIAEETAWAALTRELGARGRFFYRRRRLNINRKAGNLADFCRRWGRRYRYMVVLDADSVMSGETVLQLVRLMERHPRAGIIQTAPRLARGETLFARLHQFASRLYGPVFQAGLNWWQLSEANYWGHNAIIRVEPFIEHCALPDLPGSEPIGGRILSHDYVEAALMRRAGWGVWLVPELEGTFEESPANLIDFLKRDRRWMQGNLQHTWLLSARGLHLVNRLHFLLGALAYLASSLWLLLLVLSTALVLRQSLTGLSFLPRDSAWTPLVGDFATEAAGLCAGTFAILLLPKAIALLDLGRRRAARVFGGWRRVLAGAASETVASALAAPVLMLFHARFLWSLLAGQSATWAAQRRGTDGSPDARETATTFAGCTAVGLVWTGIAAALGRDFLAWMSPILVALLASGPFAAFTGHRGLGARLARRGWLRTPEETAPPPELRMESLDTAPAGAASLPPELAGDSGILHAVLDPYVNAIHVALLREKRTKVPPETNSILGALRTRLITAGPRALTTREKLALLLDANSMIRLHHEVWAQPEPRLAEWWRAAIREFQPREPDLAAWRAGVRPGGITSPG